VSNGCSTQPVALVNGRCLFPRSESLRTLWYYSHPRILSFGTLNRGCAKFTLLVFCVASPPTSREQTQAHCHLCIRGRDSQQSELTRKRKRHGDYRLPSLSHMKSHANPSIFPGNSCCAFSVTHLPQLWQTLLYL
jgi:hypothetical protein